MISILPGATHSVGEGKTGGICVGIFSPSWEDLIAMESSRENLVGLGTRSFDLHFLSISTPSRVEFVHSDRLGLASTPI